MPPRFVLRHRWAGGEATLWQFSQTHGDTASQPQSPAGKVTRCRQEARAHIEESSQETAPGKLSPLRHQMDTRRAPLGTGHASTIRPRPCLRQLSTAAPRPAPLQPPACRAPLDDDAPPALTASAEMGARGWPPTCRYATMLTNTKTVSDFST